MWMMKNGKGYYATTIQEIIEDQTKGIKFIKVHYDQNRYVELMVYNSNVFTKEAPSYEGVTILDRFQIQYQGNTMQSKAFDIVFNKGRKVLKKLNRGKLKIKNWITIEEAIEVLKEVEDMVVNTDNFRTADILAGDYEPNRLGFQVS